MVSDRAKSIFYVHSYISGTQGVNTKPFCASTQALFPGHQVRTGQLGFDWIKIKIISSSQIKMNYLHWCYHLSFLDVSPQIIPAKKPWETRLNFPAVSSGWREEYETILKEPESGRDTIHTYPTEIRFFWNNFSPTKLLARNKLLRYSTPFFWKNDHSWPRWGELQKETWVRGIPGCYSVALAGKMCDRTR